VLVEAGAVTVTGAAVTVTKSVSTQSRFEATVFHQCTSLNWHLASCGLGLGDNGNVLLGDSLDLGGGRIRSRCAGNLLSLLLGHCGSGKGSGLDIDNLRSGGSASDQASSGETS
jgi:hypothetical protein